MSAKQLNDIQNTSDVAIMLDGVVKKFLTSSAQTLTLSHIMMCGLLKPTSGVAHVLGIDLQKSPSLAHQQVGYMAQKFSLYGDLTVLQNLQFYAGIYGMKGKVRANKITQMVDTFGLGSGLNANANELSLGYKQRLSLACAIMHEPAILFLDEPISGVDPLSV